MTRKFCDGCKAEVTGKQYAQVEFTSRWLDLCLDRPGHRACYDRWGDLEKARDRLAALKGKEFDAALADLDKAFFDTKETKEVQVINDA